MINNNKKGLKHRTVIIAFDELEMVEQPSKCEEISNYRVVLRKGEIKCQ
jgi:hypothetical protein